MRIAFITGCLPPGKSGVGDYVIDLADECSKQGNECKIIGINDDFVDKVTETKRPGASGLSANEFEHPLAVTSLRVASQWPWKRRMAIIREAIEKFDADLISIQFVCYGYQRKGLIWGLANRLKDICRNRKVHLMFHELWIGESRGSTLKHRVMGSIQKRLVLDLVCRLKPGIIHANCSTYVEILRRNGVSAERLPLFGSIPIVNMNADEQKLPSLIENGLDISQKMRSAFWLFGMFGSLHPEWKAEPIFSYICEASGIYNKQSAIISIGQKGHAGERLWRELTVRYQDQLHFLELGQQPAEKVSEVFLSLDFGLAATPAALIGKSASVAAMLEHGLPVIVPRDDYQLEVPFEPEEMKNPMLIRLTPSLVKELAGLKRIPAASCKERVTNQFLQAIGAKRASDRLQEAKHS